MSVALSFMRNRLPPESCWSIRQFIVPKSRHARLRTNNQRCVNLLLVIRFLQDPGKMCCRFLSYAHRTKADSGNPQFIGQHTGWGGIHQKPLGFVQINSPAAEIIIQPKLRRPWTICKITFQQFGECPFSYIFVSFITSSSKENPVSDWQSDNSMLILPCICLSLLCWDFELLKIKGRCSLVKQLIPSQNSGHYQDLLWESCSCK